MNPLNAVDTSIIFFYLALTLGVGIYAGRRVANIEDYAVAGRKYSAWIVFATLSASFIGGGFTIGNAEKVFVMGIVYIVALWGFSLKEILVATLIAPRIGDFPKAISVGDVMERDYGKTGKVVTGFFSVLLCAGILGAQVGGIGKIFHVFVGTAPWVGILLGAGIVILYSTIGGMKSVVATDIMQFAVLVVGIPLVLIFGVWQAGGAAVVLDQAPAGHLGLFTNKSAAAFASLFLTFLLGETLVPPYVLRLFVGKDVQAVARGTLWSGILSIPFFAIVGGIGLVAAVLMPGLEDATLALPAMVREVLPIGLRGIVVAGIIAVVMSSADSFLNAASIALANDIAQPFSAKTLSERTSLRVARLATFITGVLAIIFAVSITSILDILIYAYNFWAPIILVPLAAALLGWRSTRAAFIAGAGAGILAVLLWWRLPGSFQEFDGLIVGVFANFAAFSITHRLTTRPQETAP